MRQTDVLLVIAILAVAGVATGMLKIPGLTLAAGAGGPTGEGGQPLGIGCQTDGTNDVNVDVKNPDATTALYLLGNAVVTDEAGQTLANGPTRNGGSLNYATFNIACGTTGTIYILGNGSTNGAKMAYDANKMSSYHELLSLNFTTGMNLQARDSAYANDSGATSVANQTEWTSTHTIGSGGSVSGFIDASINESNTGFGSADGGIIVSFDASTSKFAKQDIMLWSADGKAAVAPISCPDSAIRLRSAKVCFKLPQIKSTMGNPIRFGYSLKASLGDPGAADDVLVYFDASDYFRDADGKIKLDIANSASSAVMPWGSRFMVDLA